MRQQRRDGAVAVDDDAVRARRAAAVEDAAAGQDGELVPGARGVEVEAFVVIVLVRVFIGADLLPAGQVVARGVGGFRDVAAGVVVAAALAAAGLPGEDGGGRGLDGRRERGGEEGEGGEDLGGDLVRLRGAGVLGHGPD